MNPLLNFAVTFADAGDRHAPVNIVTARFDPLVQRNDIGRPQSWANALAATTIFRADLWASLRPRGAAFPLGAARAMHDELAWRDGHAALQDTVAGTGPVPDVAVQFYFHELSNRLLPELVPVQRNGGTVPLDRIGPCSRHLDTGRERPTPRRTNDTSLAILYQVGDRLPFRARAVGLQEQLMAESAGRVRVNAFDGGALAGSSDERRLRELNEIFFNHQAVLFLGHSSLPPLPPAWMLTPTHPLPLADIHNRFAARRSAAVPQLVFACCCRSAAGQPGPGHGGPADPPFLFLNAGVRFFIGTSLDVPVDRDLALVSELLRAFFGGWWRAPDAAVRHLYEAKRACDFDLVTSLFQIYAGPQPVDYLAAPAELVAPTGPVAPPDVPAVSPAPPLGAIVGGIAPGDTLGGSEVVGPAWSDAHSRTFRTKAVGDARALLVTVLADEFQGRADLADRLRDAIRETSTLRAEPRLYLPARYELLELARGGKRIGAVHALVGELPWAEPFRPLAEPLADGRRDFDRAVRTGEDVANALVVLHAAGIPHGNLDPGSVVLVDTPGRPLAVLKDTWVRAALGGRYTPARYAPPASANATDPPDDRRHDIWGLGVLLYELAAGVPPFDADHPPERGPRPLADVFDPADAARLPPVLPGVIRDCLLPAERYLPTAADIATRLLLGQFPPGSDASPLEARLHDGIQAGHRLFAVAGASSEDTLAAIRPLAARLHPCSRVMEFEGKARGAVAPPIRYRLLTFAHGHGLTDLASGQTPVPWRQAAQLIEPGDLGPPDEAEVDRRNAEAAFETLAKLRPHEVRGANGPELQVPLVVICGNRWWAESWSVLRTLKDFHDAPARSPAILLADHRLDLPTDLAERFVGLLLPPPRPAELSEFVREFVQAHHAGPTANAAALAMTLTRQLYPTSRREAELTLRLCVFRHGVVSEHAAAIRDEFRATEFQSLGGATYTPPAELPGLEAVGLSDAVRSAARRWVRHLHDGDDRADDSAVPQVVLVSGAAGCGKTALARALAGAADRPLVRLDASGWLRGGLGESEAVLARLLARLGELHHAIVLFDDLDQFFPNPDQAAQGHPPTFARLSAILLRWLEHPPEGIAVVLAARAAASLPAEWRRRVRLGLDLPEPTGEVRARVFAAVFRRCGLPHLADDGRLAAHLAERTQAPDGEPVPVPGPLARRWPKTFPAHVVLLKAGAQIEAWVHETLTLFDRPPWDATARDFWWHAIP